MYESLNQGKHYEPLRPHRCMGINEKYEFTHGEQSLCVYDINTMEFVKEIPVGPNPDCHATSLDNSYVYIACHDGLYIIGQESLEVERVFEIDKCYATNTLPDGNTLLVHDQCGGVVIIRDITDMDKIHIHKRIQVIPDGKYRCEIGGKGNFIENGKYYLCCGWTQNKLYLFDVEDDFSFEIFIDTDPILYASDDLVITRDKTKAYCACWRGDGERSHVAVIDIANRKIAKTIPTGGGTCGLTMTADEKYVIASNDYDDTISVIDTEIDEVINTPCATEGFKALGLKGYIQGISCGKDDSVFVYDCSGSGALVRFFDITDSNKYIISTKNGIYKSF